MGLKDIFGLGAAEVVSYEDWICDPDVGINSADMQCRYSIYKFS